MDLSIVIVNWNSGDQLRECLASIGASAARLPSGCALHDVVVVDNGSTDGSDQRLSEQCGRVQLVRNAVNRGFAAACNQGAAGLRSDLILFLNPDTRLFDNSLTVPLAYLSEPAHARTGIAGIQMVDESGQVARSCARFPTANQFACQALGIDRLLPDRAHAMREWDHADSRSVDQVIGAFFLIRRAVFVQLHGFDERFFVYFEEVDLALRALQAGWRSMYLADAQAFHRGGGTTEQIKGRRLFYSLRSRLIYGRKHFAPAHFLLLAVVTCLLEPVARLTHLVATGRFLELGALVEAYYLLVSERLRSDTRHGR